MFDLGYFTKSKKTFNSYLTHMINKVIVFDKRAGNL